MARKQYATPDTAQGTRGAGLLNIAPAAAAQRGPSQSPVSTTVRGKAADRMMATMQRQAAKTGGKTTGPAAAAMFNAMQRQAKQQQAKKGGR